MDSFPLKLPDAPAARAPGTLSRAEAENESARTKSDQLTPHPSSAPTAPRTTVLDMASLTIGAKALGSDQTRITGLDDEELSDLLVGIRRGFKAEGGVWMLLAPSPEAEDDGPSGESWLTWIPVSERLFAAFDREEIPERLLDFGIID